MLKFCRISPMYRYSRPIHMQLPYNAAPTLISVLGHQLGPEGTLFRTLSQTQQANEDILFRIFVGKESLPATVGCIISPKQLDRFWTHFVMDFVYLYNFRVKDGSYEMSWKHTPTSRNRTSRHSAPKSFIRLSANSRKFPEFSQPLDTKGRGISLQKPLLLTST